MSVPARRLKKRGRAFVAQVGSQGDLHRVLRALRLKALRNGVVQLSAASAVLDFTRAGVRELHPPFTLLMGVGDDSATVTIDCPVGGRIVRCGA